MERLKRNRIWMLLITLCGSTLFIGCTADDGVTVECPVCEVVERTDIQVTGAIEESYFQTSKESDASVDLVGYNFYGAEANKLDFKITFGSGNQLVIRIFDEFTPKPWELINTPWNMYPSEVLEDRSSYVSIDFLNEEGGVAFASSGENFDLPEILLGVFFVTFYDGVEIHGRIRDMNLLNTSNPEESILVNGTFVGAVTF